MKVHILTWYKELNHGAVLQAYASQEYIKGLGYAVDILDYTREKKLNLSKRKVFAYRVKRLLTGDYRYKAIYRDFIKEKSFLFSNFIKNKLELGKCYNSKNYKCVMIGSDMVFNIIEGYYPYMFGKGIDADYLFSYAACSGGTSIKLIEKLGVKEEVKNSLEKFDKIGCRDKSTKNFVKILTKRDDIFENVDPVLLYGFENEKYDWNSGTWKKHKPYIIIYAYHGNLNSRKEIREIKKFALENDLDIISCGNFHHWCDENINASPEQFFEMIYESQMVVTDTFHGTVFSLICKKNFCSIVRSNAFKLQYLLECAHLEDRIPQKTGDIYNILKRDVDYDKFYNWLKMQRKESDNYIKLCLNEASCN